MLAKTHLEGQLLKNYLLKLIEKINEQTTVEDIFKQIALIEDVYIAEQQIAAGEGITQEELEKRSKLWIKLK